MIDSLESVFQALFQLSLHHFLDHDSLKLVDHLRLNAKQDSLHDGFLFFTFHLVEALFKHLLEILFVFIAQQVLPVVLLHHFSVFILTFIV